MQLKKLVAGALGALMVGATAGLAATLADYPAPFAQDGNLNSVIVVGAAAAAADVVGAANLGARLAGESYTLTTAGTTTGTVSGGSVYSKDVPFAIALTSSNQWKTPLKSSDVDALKTGSVTLNSSTYNWEETVTIAPVSGTMINTSSGADKSLETTPHLLYAANSIKYTLNFTTSFDGANVNAGQPLTLTMLGKTFKITEMGAASFTASLADEKFLKVGESYTVEGKEVKLVDVATDVAIVTVGGVSGTINEGSTETINGVKVKLVKDFYKSNDAANSGATIQAGTDITKTYATGDAFPGESTTDPFWVWDLGGLSADGTTAANSWMVKNTKASATTATGTPSAIAVGQALNFPNNYVKLGLDSVTTHNEATYTLEYQSTADRSINGATPSGVFKLSTTQADGITAATSSAKTKAIYLVPSSDWTSANSNGSVNVSYVDSNNKQISDKNFTTGNIADLTFQDTTIDVFWTSPSNVQLQFRELTSNVGTWVSVNLSNFTTTGFSGMNTVSSAEATDVNINSTSNSAATSGIGTRDEDVLTTYGVIINAPKSNAASDKVVLTVPSVQLKGFVSLKAGTGSTGTATAGQVKTVKPVTTAIAKLDTEAAADTTSKNVVLVGGPCANTLVQQLAAGGKLKRTSGNTTTDLTCNGWRATGENFGVIAVVNDAFATGYAALVVAGTRAEDTLLGTQILQDYTTHAAKLKGNMVEYSGSSVSTVTFK